MLTMEAVEDARPVAAVKPQAPQQVSPPTTATSLAQRIYVVAAASRSIYNGFAPTKKETTLDDTVDVTTVA